MDKWDEVISDYAKSNGMKIEDTVGKVQNSRTTTNAAISAYLKSFKLK